MALLSDAHTNRMVHPHDHEFVAEGSDGLQRCVWVDRKMYGKPRCGIVLDERQYGHVSSAQKHEMSGYMAGQSPERRPDPTIKGRFAPPVAYPPVGTWVRSGRPPARRT